MKFPRAGLAVALVVAAAAAGQQEIRNPYTSPADIAAGAKMYRWNCAECHGLKGEGGRGPSLASGNFFHGSADEDLRRNIFEGIPGTAMPALRYTPDQVWKLVSYVRSLNSNATEVRPEGNAERGARLFREKDCISCHQVRGDGGIQGPDLSFIGSSRSVENLRQSILDPNAEVSRRYWVARVALRSGPSYAGFIMNEDTHILQLLDFSRGLKSLPKADFQKMEIDKFSIMPSYQDRIAPDDVNDLIAYLWSLKFQAGGR